MKRLLALLALFPVLAYGQAAQVNCAPATPCNPVTGPSNTGTGDPPWKAFGKANFVLAPQSANQVYAGPTTGAAAAPSFRSLVAADLPALSGFSQITAGTNTTAAMLVGTGASLGYTGTGTVNANQLNGAAPATSAGVAATNSSGQIIAATTVTVLRGTTGTISGSVANLACDTGTATLTGIQTNYAVAASAVNTNGPGTGWIVTAYGSSANTVTVNVCNFTGATGAPNSSAYNVVAFP